MPFNLTNAPGTFQYAMTSVLAPYLDRFVLVYLDDILTYFKSYQKHLEHLKTVVVALRKNKLNCKRSKCLFILGIC
jgi:Reverse transcriptase (RNA-dependent DNA polymerase)